MTVQKRNAHMSEDVARDIVRDLAQSDFEGITKNQYDHPRGALLAWSTWANRNNDERVSRAIGCTHFETVMEWYTWRIRELQSDVINAKARS